MNPLLDAKLCQDFPLTFRDRHGAKRSTCMVWGFPGDGWEPLIRRAAEKIEPIIQKFIDDGKESNEDRLTSMQVKEKFGTLRWYFTFSHPDIDAIIKEAEKESCYTCEDCGGEGKIRDGSYTLTQCDNCYRKQIQRKARDYLFYEVIRELRRRVDVAFANAGKEGTSIHGSYIDEEIKNLEEWWKKKKEKKDDKQDD